VLAGDEFEVAVVVGEPPRCIATDQVGSLCTDDPSGGGREFRLWAGSASDGPGWAPLEGPWLDRRGRVPRPVTFRVPDVIVTGRCWVEIAWVREDLLEPSAQGMSGAARAPIEVVGPTAAPAAGQATPRIELAGDVAEGGDLRCTLVGTVRGRLALPESVAALEIREPQRWRRVATLFAGWAGRPPRWLPAGEGWFGYGPVTAGEQVFRLPPDLPTGEYRVAVRYQAEPPALDHVNTADSALAGPPSTRVWCGLLRRSFRLDDRHD